MIIKYVQITFQLLFDLKSFRFLEPELVCITEITASPNMSPLLAAQ
jgi:hypothetical protein